MSRTMATLIGLVAVVAVALIIGLIASAVGSGR
jgi:hypothetical protein